MLEKELYFQVTLSSREEQEQEIYLRSLWEGHALFLKKNNLFVEFITLLDLDDCQRKRSTLLLRGICCKPFISLHVVCSTYLFSLLVQAPYWLIMVCLLHFLTLFCWELPCQPGGWIQAVQRLTPKGARPRSCAGGGCSLPQSTLHLKSQPAPELPLGLLCSPAAPPAAGCLFPVPLLTAIPTNPPCKYCFWGCSEEAEKEDYSVLNTGRSKAGRAYCSIHLNIWCNEALCLGDLLSAAAACTNCCRSWRWSPVGPRWPRWAAEGVAGSGQGEGAGLAAPVSLGEEPCSC